MRGRLSRYFIITVLKIFEKATKNPFTSEVKCMRRETVVFSNSLFLCEKSFGTMREKSIHVGSKINGERKTFKPLNDPSHCILGRFGYGYRNMYLPSCCFGALLGAPILRAEQFRYYW